MPKLYSTNKYDDNETIAVVKDPHQPETEDNFVNIEVEDLERPPETHKDCERKLKGDYVFAPLPRKVKLDHHPFCLYIAGCKGAGKTKFMSNWMKNYKVLTKNPVYLISSKTSDPTIDRNIGEDKINRIDTKAFQVEKGDDRSDIPTIEDFSDCLVCFDDFANDLGAKEIQHLINVLVERGRQKNISVICIYHNITNSFQTKLVLNEADYFLIFPKKLANHNFHYFCERYGNIDDKKLLERLKRWETGSFCLISREPKYLITSQCVMLPDYVQEFEPEPNPNKKYRSKKWKKKHNIPESDSEEEDD